MDESEDYLDALHERFKKKNAAAPFSVISSEIKVSRSHVRNNFTACYSVFLYVQQRCILRNLNKISARMMTMMMMMTMMKIMTRPKKRHWKVTLLRLMMRRPTLTNMYFLKTY